MPFLDEKSTVRQQISRRIYKTKADAIMFSKYFPKSFKFVAANTGELRVSVGQLLYDSPIRSIKFHLKDHQALLEDPKAKK